MEIFYKRYLMLTPILSNRNLLPVDYGFSFASILRQILMPSLMINPKKSELLTLKSYCMKNKAICLIHYFPDNSFNGHHGDYIVIYEKNNKLFILREKMNKSFYSQNFNKPLNKIILEDYIGQDLADTCKRVILNFKLCKKLKEKISNNKNTKI